MADTNAPYTAAENEAEQYAAAAPLASPKPYMQAILFALILVVVVAACIGGLALLTQHAAAQNLEFIEPESKTVGDYTVGPGLRKVERDTLGLALLPELAFLGTATDTAAVPSAVAEPFGSRTILFSSNAALNQGTPGTVLTTRDQRPSWEALASSLGVWQGRLSHPGLLVAFDGFFNWLGPDPPGQDWTVWTDGIAPAAGESTAKLNVSIRTQESWNSILAGWPVGSITLNFTPMLPQNWVIDKRSSARHGPSNLTFYRRKYPTFAGFSPMYIDVAGTEPLKGNNNHVRFQMRYGDVPPTGTLMTVFGAWTVAVQVRSLAT